MNNTTVTVIYWLKAPLPLHLHQALHHHHQGHQRPFPAKCQRKSTKLWNPDTKMPVQYFQHKTLLMLKAETKFSVNPVQNLQTFTSNTLKHWEMIVALTASSSSSSTSSSYSSSSCSCIKRNTSTSAPTKQNNMPCTIKDKAAKTFYKHSGFTQGRTLLKYLRGLGHRSSLITSANCNPIKCQSLQFCFHLPSYFCYKQEPHIGVT